MDSAIETSDLKLSGELVQVSQNCDAKHERMFNYLHQISTSVGTSLEGVVGAYSGGNLGTVTY